MNCEQVRERLSSYHDGELDESVRLEVSAHLEGCPGCKRELQAFRGMSSLFERWEPPASLTDAERGWEQIKRQLHPSESARGSESPGQSSRMKLNWATYLVAAMVLLAAGVTMSLMWPTHATHERTDLDLNRFVADFAEDPQVAQERLLANFEGRPATVDEVVEVFKKSPSIVDGLPADYRLVSLNLVKMPCCTCPQAVLQSKDGKMVCVFEHEPNTGVLVNGCPMIRCRCCERNVKIAEVGSSILASWPSKDSTITAVGFGSIEEMVQFVDAIEKSKEQALFRRKEIRLAGS
jgi:hypothetical protein